MVRCVETGEVIGKERSLVDNDEDKVEVEVEVEVSR